MLLDYNIIRKMIEIILAWASLFALLYIIKEHNKTVKDYNELLDEYNELVDDYNCQKSLIEHYEYKIWTFIKKLRELNNLTLDNNENDK